MSRSWGGVQPGREHIAQRGSGGPIPESIQGQLGWCSEQPGLVEDNPAHCRRVGLDDL